jgi:quercetin dioxygenase-like cupin family protein
VDAYHLDFVLLTIQSGAQREMVQTDAHEFKYILSGKVEYTISGEVYLMEEGDSIFFDATEPHNPKNMGDSDAILLAVYLFNNPK